MHPHAVMAGIRRCSYDRELCYKQPSSRELVAPAVGVGVVVQQAGEGAAGGAGVAECAPSQGADAVHGLDQVEAGGDGAGRQRRVVRNVVLRDGRAPAVMSLQYGPAAVAGVRQVGRRCSVAEHAGASNDSDEQNRANCLTCSRD